MDGSAAKNTARQQKAIYGRVAHAAQGSQRAGSHPRHHVLPGRSPAPPKAAPASSNGEGVEDETAVPGEDKAEKKAAAKTPKRKEVEVVEKTNVRELRDYVINEGRKDFSIQRYKGLGEMTAPQLWETTMDPERRTLLSVRLEDIAECETIFTTLMGEDVEARRKFIEENALDVKNLDI